MTLLSPSQTSNFLVHGTFTKQQKEKTALVGVTNNLLTVVDAGLPFLFTFLGLFAAFEIIDHEILLNMLHNQNSGARVVMRV